MCNLQQLPLSHNWLAKQFIGLDTHYPLITGESTPRRYFDSAASTLAMAPAESFTQRFMQHYSNTHSTVHYSARIATATYHWAHRVVLNFVNADESDYACVFIGSGATAGINRLARLFKSLQPERDTVLVSLMEHHSNDLPHRQHHTNIISIPCTGHGSDLGTVDLSVLEQRLIQYNGRINYVSVTAASNVTGIINPIHEIARIVHKYNAYVLVDASQIAAHAPIQMQLTNDDGIDAVVFSGHKLYAPGSPGVMVVKRDLLSKQAPSDIGGGVVDWVTLDDYSLLTQLPEREEAGTPNIIGAIKLAAVLQILQQQDFANLCRRETQLLDYFLTQVKTIKGIKVYGSLASNVTRTPTIAFNIEGLGHGLVAAILNDYYNIAVRNECFCAHPYVRAMLTEG